MKTTAFAIPASGNTNAPIEEVSRSLALRRVASLQDKLTAFNPLEHGGEAMQDLPQGVELAAFLADRNS